MRFVRMKANIEIDADGKTFLKPKKQEKENASRP
jgi:hypothetical protein